MAVCMKSELEKILQDNPFLTVDYFFAQLVGVNPSMIVGDFLCISCMANTYLTPNYKVIFPGYDEFFYKDFFIRHPEKMTSFNRYGGPFQGHFVYDVSSKHFKLHGRGLSLAIFDNTTLELLDVVYFDSDDIAPVELLGSYNNNVIFEFDSVVYIYDLDYNINSGMYATIDKIPGNYAKVIDQYILIFQEPTVGNSEDLTILDLKDERKAIFHAWEYRVDIEKTTIDLLSDKLLVYDTESKNLQYSLELDELWQRYEVEYDLEGISDGTIMGSRTTTTY